MPRIVAGGVIAKARPRRIAVYDGFSGLIARVVHQLFFITSLLSLPGWRLARVFYRGAVAKPGMVFTLFQSLG